MAEAPLSIMPLRDRSTLSCCHHHEELGLIIEQFERVVAEGAEPPSWTKVWGDHVTNQPLRTSSTLKLLEPPAPSGLLR